ncbi:MAG TPA: TrmH family RNA methyltransferase [Acidimicrobiales bacterium]|nr:TrmH family RNA methyltransferase [Acidimicrobiales bacterium]
MGRLATRDGPDGVAAVVQLADWQLGSLLVSERARVLVVDGAEMAGNVGSLIRCADGAGADAVIVTTPRARVLHPQAIKASMGTIFSMPIVEASPSDAVAWVRSQGMTIVAADPAAHRHYRDFSMRGPTAVVVGSERQGLSEDWRQAADVVVRIPMLGRADSLNIGHAAALLLYEALHHQLG